MYNLMLDRNKEAEVLAKRPAIYNANREEPLCTYEQVREPRRDQLYGIEARLLGFFRLMSRFARLTNFFLADPIVPL